MWIFYVLSVKNDSKESIFARAAVLYHNIDVL